MSMFRNFADSYTFDIGPPTHDDVMRVANDIDSVMTNHFCAGMNDDELISAMVLAINALSPWMYSPEAQCAIARNDNDFINAVFNQVCNDSPFYSPGNGANGAKYNDDDDDDDENTEEYVHIDEIFKETDNSPLALPESVILRAVKIWEYCERGSTDEERSAAFGRFSQLAKSHDMRIDEFLQACRIAR